MNRISIVGAALLALSAGAARAAGGADDLDFVTRASAGDLMAVAESRLALDRAAAPGVRDFARHVVAERGGDAAALRSAAEGSGAVVPMAPDSEGCARLAALGALSGSDFDRAYLGDQAAIQSNALTLYGDYMLLGEDAALKALAIRMIPVAGDAFKRVQSLEGR